MAATFDPYHRWLAIPPAEQPPNYYRLLGITLFEHDPDVIEQASERQMTHLRKVSSGPNVKDSQRLLNEVAGAASCLLDPSRREAYDDILRKEVAKKEPAAKSSPGADPFHVSAGQAAAMQPIAAVEADDHFAELPTVAPLPSYAVSGQPFVSQTQPRRGGATLPPWVLPVGVGGGVLLLLLLGVGGGIAVYSLATGPTTLGTPTRVVASNDAIPTSADGADPDNASSTITPAQTANNSPPTFVGRASPSGNAPRFLEPPAVLARVTPQKTISADAKAVHCARFSADGKSIATGGSELHIRIWDSATGELRFGEARSKAPVKGLAYSPDGEQLVTVLLDNVRFNKAEDARPFCAFKTFQDPVNNVEFSPDGRYLLVTAHGYRAKVWEGRVPAGNLGELLQFDIQESQRLRVGKFSPDSSLVALGGDNGYLVVRSIPQGTMKFELSGHAAPVTSLAFSPDGARLYSADAGGVLREWDLQTGRPLQVRPIFPGGISSLAVSPEGGHVLCGTPMGAILSFPRNPRAPAFRLPAHRGVVTSLEFSPDGSQFLSAGLDGDVKTWLWRTELLP